MYMSYVVYYYSRASSRARPMTELLDTAEKLLTWNEEAAGLVVIA